MSRYIPHPAYAEDQPYAYSFLTFHVLARTYQTGAVFGLTTSAVRRLLSRNPAVLLSTGRGALIGTAIMTVGLPIYMSGKTEIEWRDRTWRLLENQGQMEVDDWSGLGFLAGAAVAGRREARAQLAKGRGIRIAGGAGVGSLAGVLGYMGWRYGVHGGKWSETARD